MSSTRATFPRPYNTPMTPPSSSHPLALPSPRATVGQMKTFSVTLLEWTCSHHIKQKLRITGRVGSQKIVSTQLEVERNSLQAIDQTFYFPWDSTSTALKIDVVEDKTWTQIAQVRLPIREPYINMGANRMPVPLYDMRNNPWGEIVLHIEFLACPERLRATQVDSKIAEICHRNESASPVQNKKSPLANVPTKDEVFDADYPFHGVRVYCDIGAGWKKLKTKPLHVVVGLGAVGLKCTEPFTVTDRGDFKVARVFEFPFQRERRIKILVHEASSGQLLAEGAFDTLDLVNGNVLTCKQNITFYDPDYPGRIQGYMQVLTEFCYSTLKKEVRTMTESAWPLGGNKSPTATPEPGLPVVSEEGSMTTLTGLSEAQVPSGNTKEILKFSPFSDMRTVLIQVLAVADLPSADDVCTVQVCLGWYRSATGNYYHARSDLRAGIFELHRIPYAKQRFAKVILRVSNSQGGVKEATAWLDLKMLGSPSNIRAQLLMGSGDNYLGKVHLKLEFIPDILELSTPIKIEKEDVLRRTSLYTLIRQHESKNHTRHARSKSPAFIRPLTLGNLCAQSPLISPRSREGTGKSDALLESILSESITPASAEPHPSMDCEMILLQLVGFRNLPALDGLRLLKLQLVLRVGSRVKYTTHVLDTSDTDPNFKSLLFRLPMIELRFLTIDVFERTMTYKPFYLGRVVIDTASVRPGQVVATYEQLTGLSGSTYCLYALENITDVDSKERAPPQATLIQNIKAGNSPLAKYTIAAAESDESTGESEPPAYGTLTRSTFCVKLRSLQGMVSPFPFNSIDVSVRVEYQETTVTSAPISLDVGKHTNINQIVKVPKTANPFGTLHFSLLAGCPVRRPVEVLSRTIDVRTVSPSNTQETVVSFGDNGDTKLFVTLSEVQEPCRAGVCEAIRSNPAEFYFPSLVSV